MKYVKNLISDYKQKDFPLNLEPNLHTITNPRGHDQKGQLSIIRLIQQ